MRRNLTSNNRAFGKNPRSFINRFSKAPLEITIDDSVNPVYILKVSPLTAEILNPEDVPSSTTVKLKWLLDIGDENTDI